MKSSRVTAVLVFTIAACVPPPKEAPEAPPVEEGLQKAGIVGGNNTTIAQHPWQVSVGTQFGGYFCGGSIIDREWVLTAQHCIEGTSVSSLRISAGVTRRSQANSGQVRSVDQLIPFPGYIEPDRGRDVALLHLSSPLTINASVQPIAIATAAHVMAGRTDPGVNAQVSGWGTLRSGGSSPDVLQEVTVPIVSNAQADAAYSGINITADQIGAGVLGTGGRDSCQGDSGGPLTVPDGNGGRILAGVVSWGFGCADPRWPGMYARVSSFATWIQGNVDPNAAPTVAITAPSNGATLSGNITASANASDSDGSIARVTFTFPDGSRIDDTSAPYSVTWNSAQSADGPGTIRAQAFDDDGAGSAVDTVSVTTSNGNSSCATGTYAASDTPSAIPDNNTNGITSTIVVNGQGTIADLTVSLGITHTWRGDLSVQLVSPSGTTAVLHNRSGQSADDLVLSNVDVSAFDGESASGAWRLVVRDLAAQDVGTLDGWSIAVSATCGGSAGWSASRTPNLATVDNGIVCDSVTVSGSGSASDARMDLSGTHAWRSILRGTLAHNGVTVVVFDTGTFPREGGSFGFTDRAVPGFSGSASGTWTFCLEDTDAFGDSGVLGAWSVHD